MRIEGKGLFGFQSGSSSSVEQVDVDDGSESGRSAVSEVVVAAAREMDKKVLLQSVERTQRTRKLSTPRPQLVEEEGEDDGEDDDEGVEEEEDGDDGAGSGDDDVDEEEEEADDEGDEEEDGTGEEEEQDVEDDEDDDVDGLPSIDCELEDRQFRRRDAPSEQRIVGTIGPMTG